MNFFKGELKNFDLYKMNEDMIKKVDVKRCSNSISICLDKKEKSEHIEEMLKCYGQLYYFFGNRNEKYLYCINDERYLINDEINENHQGINMSDLYINPYEDINLGFLILYDNGNIDIKPAIEGESIRCRRCEIVEDCGDLNKEMNNFISKYIL